MKATVLIVDDHSDLRKLIRMTLECEGLTLHEAAQGQAAIDIARKTNPALILLDVMMPGELDGLAVCRQLRADPQFRRTRIILLTAKGQRQDRQCGLEAGADAYLTKPFSPLELMEAAESWLLGDGGQQPPPGAVPA